MTFSDAILPCTKSWRPLVTFTAFLNLVLPIYGKLQPNFISEVLMGGIFLGHCSGPRRSRDIPEKNFMQVALALLFYDQGVAGIPLRDLGTFLTSRVLEMPTLCGGGQKDLAA